MPDVSDWVRRLGAGDREAAGPLWQEYSRRLIGLARKKLRDQPRRVADEEDVALSAFDSLCRGVEQGRFPQLEDRHDLWSLLAVITVRKALDQIVRRGRIGRGGGKVRGESAFAQPGDGSGAGRGIEQIAGDEPTPAFAAAAAEQGEELLRALPEGLRCVAVWKVEGYTNQEIAARLGRSLATVERKLSLIRDAWKSHPLLDPNRSAPPCLPRTPPAN